MNLPIGKTASLALLNAQKHSPTIMFGAGVVGVLGTVVLASRSTLRLSDVLEEATQTVEKINTLEHDDYSPEDRVKDKAILYTQTTLKIAKLYAPAITVGIISVGLLSGSHHILSRRNVALTAAYAGAEKALTEYRGRVIEAIGAEKESVIWQPVEQVDAIDEAGKKVKVSLPTEAGGSPYKVLFAEHNPNWNKDFSYNQVFIQAQQNYANDLLRSRGYVFLNEVHTMLGLEHTKAGQIVGWVWNGDGDNFIDFGVFTNEFAGMRFVNNEERSIWLDFNVDGPVLNILD